MKKKNRRRSSKWELQTLKVPSHSSKIKKLIPGTEINLDDRLPVYKTCTLREIVAKINEIIDHLNKTIPSK